MNRLATLIANQLIKLARSIAPIHDHPSDAPTLKREQLRLRTLRVVFKDRGALAYFKYKES